MVAYWLGSWYINNQELLLSNLIVRRYTIYSVACRYLALELAFSINYERRKSILFLWAFLEQEWYNILVPLRLSSDSPRYKSIKRELPAHYLVTRRSVGSSKSTDKLPRHNSIHKIKFPLRLPNVCVGANDVWSLGISTMTQSYRVVFCTEDKQSFDSPLRKRM